MMNQFFITQTVRMARQFAAFVGIFETVPEIRRVGYDEIVAFMIYD